MAFKNLKVVVAKKPVVKTFDPIKDIVVTTDRNISSGFYPIIYLMIKLSKAELNY